LQAVNIAVRKRIDEFDKAYSRFRADSLVTRMSKETGIFELPPDAKEMMDLYYDLYKKTGGLVTPLIGNVLVDAGYDAEYSLKQKKDLVAPEKWEDVLDYQFPNLTMKKAALLDFGAAGKGYLVDIVSRVIEDHGVTAYCVDAGGDMVHRNSAKLRVGLEDPEDTGKVIGVCELGDESMCGSAGNRRVWKNFTHIIDPHTLVSPKEVSAVWVVAKKAIVADALTTCLFFVRPEVMAGYDFEYVIMHRNRSVERSQGFEGEVFGGDWKIAN